jgi:hypothetical protein
MSENQSLGRSFGVVRIVIDAQSIAWVRDFRKLERDVLVRLKFAWQARPGEVLSYELEPPADGSSARHQGSDLVFYTEPTLEDIFTLDHGTGLSEAGLAYLVKMIFKDPELIGKVFSKNTSMTLKSQFLQQSILPLPLSIVSVALKHSELRKTCYGQLKILKNWSAELVKNFLAAGYPRSEEIEILRQIRSCDPKFLFGISGMEQSGLAARAWNWYREFNEPAMLLCLDKIEVHRDSALKLLGQNILGNLSEIADPGSQDFRMKLGSQGTEKLLYFAFKDPARKELQNDPFIGLENDPSFIQVLTKHAKDDSFEKELNDRLDEAGQINVAIALQILPGEKDEARLKKLADQILTQLKAGGSVDHIRKEDIWKIHEISNDPYILGYLDNSEIDLLVAEKLLLSADGLTVLKNKWHYADQDLMELVSRCDTKTEESRNALAWLGEKEVVSVLIAGWLADDENREKALACLCGSRNFSRGLIQRILSMDMDNEIRSSIVRGITEANPELWEIKYLLSAEEKETWCAAGAPF